MLQRIIMLFFSILMFVFFISMLILMWYVTLPILCGLFIFAWWKLRQMRKLWQKAFAQTQNESTQKPPVEHSEIIDAEYTEL